MINVGVGSCGGGGEICILRSGREPNNVSDEGAGGALSNRSTEREHMGGCVGHFSANRSIPCGLLSRTFQDYSHLFRHLSPGNTKSLLNFLFKK